MRTLVALLLALALNGCSTDEQIRFADGSHSPLSQWQDRWLVINYWAEWCGPCRHEIPEFNALHKNREANGLVVLGVNYDNLQGDKLREVISRMQINFPVLMDDPQQRYDFPRAQILPMTVLINPQREIHDVLVGPQTQAGIQAALN